MSNAPSLQSALIDALPDLVVLVRRDGVLLASGGGRGLADLTPDGRSIGQSCETVWPPSVAELIKRLAQGAIARRASAEGAFEHLGHHYEAHASAQGPDRALCVIRRVPDDAADDAADDALEPAPVRARPSLDRRGFLRRFKNSVSLAALREKPAALAVIHVEGIADIARTFDSTVADDLMSAAILRLSPPDGGGGESHSWYLGQLSDDFLALVIESADRDSIEACVATVCASLREPLNVGEAAFHLSPYAGVAILGRDAATPKALLAHARSASAEARRSASDQISFFSDTLRLRSLARFDIARELHEAIANREIRLRYVGRHDLASGRLVAWVGYLRWIHPVRGEVRPVEFLRVAETTGLGAALSRAALARLAEDYHLLAPDWDDDVRISFGALRHHILHEAFLADITQLLDGAALPAHRLELRISEKSFIASDPTAWPTLQRLGIQLVVDEVARGLGSLDALARMPIWGLQLDRAWATAVRTDPVALKVCRAGIGVAAALGLTPIATGVDDEAQREVLLALGCRYGVGDLFHDAVPDIMKPYRAAVSA